MNGQFRPRSPVTPPLVRPVPVDTAGRAGPTPGQARGPRWRRTSPGLYVPTQTPLHVEQRVLEAAARLPPGGAVGGWAALRIRRAAYFDGVDAAGRPLPVPLVVPPTTRLRAVDGTTVVRPRRAPRPLLVEGVPCLPAGEAMLQVIAAAPRLLDAVVATDMALAAGAVTCEELRTAVEDNPGGRGVVRARRVMDLTDPRSRSPQESWLRFSWVVHAQLPAPRCNWLVSDLDGRVVGSPDLLGLEIGVIGEYDGSAHLRMGQRQVDVGRWEAFRELGLEVVVVVGRRPGDEADVVRRLRAAASRAATQTGVRRWMARETPLPRW